MYISINIFSTPCSYCPRFTLFTSRLNVGFTMDQPWTNYGATLPRRPAPFRLCLFSLAIPSSPVS